ncbi:MAG: hypothetical protein F6K40_12210 [Okeania sp. SIO3I5]|uniref:hypothetical protein n=1 Tax=Okeania sp. SIO3I5 TaxID=2607805 RepID=UPI0013B99BD6|nr:hypothetical protein [Okeania sp. SIO3I5]NEQ36993.1 hypothetical protein [Okeania sp. SIO3I5]
MAFKYPDMVPGNGTTPPSMEIPDYTEQLNSIEAKFLLLKEAVEGIVIGEIETERIEDGLEAIIAEAGKRAIALNELRTSNTNNSDAIKIALEDARDKYLAAMSTLEERLNTIDQTIVSAADLVRDGLGTEIKDNATRIETSVGSIITEIDSLEARLAEQHQARFDQNQVLISNTAEKDTFFLSKMIDRNKGGYEVEVPGGFYELTCQPTKTLPASCNGFTWASVKDKASGKVLAQGLVPAGIAIGGDIREKRKAVIVNFPGLINDKTPDQNVLITANYVEGNNLGAEIVETLVPVSLSAPPPVLPSLT